MLGPDQTTPILAQLPVSSSNAESEVASDFDNKIDKSKGYHHSPGRVGSPIRQCHDPIMGFYYSAFSNRNETTTAARCQISVRLYNTKPDKIKKNFGKLTPAKFL
jgi:hypothetical protein